MQFTDADKEVKEFNNNRFTFGVHKVQILNFVLDKTDNGKEFIEVFFVDPNNEECEDSARVWFSTDKATNFSFNILRGIYVHNAPEDKKDAARASFDAVKDTTELVELLKSKLLGKEMWYTKFFDPKRTYQGQDGQTYRSINKNIFGYQPKEQPELMPQKDGDKTLYEQGKEIFPGATDVKSDPTDSWA